VTEAVVSMESINSNRLKMTKLEGSRAFCIAELSRKDVVSKRVS